ncbi:MAG: inorganic phosphate transporter [Kofleriaceae bacterium]|nr:inorganic phosphate transporter [Kofleriaceae bacterium]
MQTIVVVTIVAALAFDIINGFHDAANSIATVVSTRVLTPRQAVVWAATFNFVALFIFGEGVANAISKIVNVNAADPAFVYVIAAGLAGAIVWNLLTWWLGLPSSSSHALVGGIGGAGVAYGGLAVLNHDNVLRIAKFIVIAPVIGFVGGSFLVFVVYWVVRKMRPQKVDKAFRLGQLVSAAAYSIGHGGNDAQKTMGVIVIVLVAGGYLGPEFAGKHPPSFPYWIVLSSYGAMAFGTAIGGWRIVKTMGMGLTHLKPIGGFCAELAGAITLFIASALKVPVSTTHTITGAIIGVGSTTNARGIRWGLASRIVWAWILTIPMAASVGAGSCLLVKWWHPWTNSVAAVSAPAPAPAINPAPLPGPAQMPGPTPP